MMCHAPVALLLSFAAAPASADTYPPDRVRYDTERATLYFEPGQLTTAQMERFAGIVDRGVADIERYLADGTVSLPEQTGKITYRISTRITMARAFRRTVLLPLERVKDDSAPYLHETTHVLLPARCECLWLSEGFASYVQSYVSEHVGGYDGSVFSRGGNRNVDHLARRYLATEGGQAVLAYVGRDEPPPDIESERWRVAAPFYVLSHSFVKFLVASVGLRTVEALHGSGDPAPALERLSGRSLPGWRAEWLSELQRHGASARTEGPR